jgi:sialidase-1
LKWIHYYLGYHLQPLINSLKMAGRAAGGTIGLNSSDECSVAQLGSGRIVMNIRNYIDQKTHKITTAAGNVVRALADSTDEGATFGPVRFATELPDPICFSDLMRVNASTHGFGHSVSDDDLLLLSNPSSTVGRKHLSIHASLDGGHRWQPLVVVEDRGLRCA